MAFAGMAFLTANYTIQTNTLLNARTKIGNPNSDVSNAISDYINDLDNQMNDISITVKNLNIKENNYINQKISFNNKLNDLSKQNQFFKDFNTMNNQTFIETNLFTTTQTEN